MHSIQAKTTLIFYIIVGWSDWLGFPVPQNKVMKLSEFMGQQRKSYTKRHPKRILFEICLWWRILNHLTVLSFMRVFRGTRNQRQFDASTESHVEKYRALLSPNMRMYEGFITSKNVTWRLIRVCHLTARHLLLEMWTPILRRLFLESK